MTKADRVLELAKRIVRLEHELVLLKAEFSRLMGEPDAAPPRTRAAVPLHAVVLIALLEHRPAVMSAEDIAQERALPLESVRAALSKLCASGRVVRVSRGLYAAHPETDQGNPTSKG